MRKLIRADGSTMDLPRGMDFQALCELIGCETADSVCLHHMGEPLHVMILDDKGYEVRQVREHGQLHLVPTRALKPINAEATALYHANCKPGTTHAIVGDVVVVPDSDFEGAP